ncbi:hypothetical protein ATANTOWER_011419, partial [Ataeniobius toweri]|nr:hypothetical protein [Ataeniobius toweri]
SVCSLLIYASVHAVLIETMPALFLPSHLFHAMSAIFLHHLPNSMPVKEFDDKSGSVLRIQPLRANRDEAIYECTATNSAGEISACGKLVVLE